MIQGAMLDLNLNVASHEQSQQNIQSVVFADKFPEGSSGTSNSSIVNADASSTVGDDESCSARAVAGDNSVITFNFDILKVGGIGDQIEGPNKSQNDGVARKEFAFFPVSESCEGQSSRNWIDLSFNNQQQQLQEGAGEVRVTQQASPAVKKSRRGPRSRSSQYRGVTFYRRTGRWESHIW